MAPSMLFNYASNRSGGISSQFYLGSQLLQSHQSIKGSNNLFDGVLTNFPTIDSQIWLQMRPKSNTTIFRFQADLVLKPIFMVSRTVGIFEYFLKYYFNGLG